jgi:large subunit ribosomal protein L25
MATIKIDAVSRASVGTTSAKALRKTGKIPAVVYGHGGPTVSVAIDRAAIEKAMAENAQTFELSVDGTPDTVLLCDAQFDLSGEFCTHVDFKRVSATEAVEVDIEVRLKGTPEGEKFGGKLDHIAHAIKVRCLPGAIPEVIIAEVDGLNIGDMLRASSLPLPAGVTLAGDPEEAVASCHHPGGAATGDADRGYRQSRGPIREDQAQRGFRSHRRTGQAALRGGVRAVPPGVRRLRAHRGDQVRRPAGGAGQAADLRQLLRSRGAGPPGPVPVRGEGLSHRDRRHQPAGGPVAPAGQGE